MAVHCADYEGAFMDLNPASVLRRHGAKKAIMLLGSLIGRPIAQFLDRIRYRNAEPYCGPSADELRQIEALLVDEGIPVIDYMINLEDLKFFQRERPFPADYHGGRGGGAWNEKILEHYIAFKLLALAEFNQDIYVDVAAGGSPWAMLLRQQGGIQAFALDRAVRSPYNDLSYYKCEDATATTFADSSVRGISLQCAYEVFGANDDIRLLYEIRRILQPGGRAIILPLYMHTHYCCYASPEYFGRDFSDTGAKKYIHWSSRGVRSSRKYDVHQLKKRVLDTISALGMNYRIFVLRNKKDIAADVYCHFILEINK